MTKGIKLGRSQTATVHAEFCGYREKKKRKNYFLGLQRIKADS